MASCLGTQESSWRLVLPRSLAAVSCDNARAEAGLGQRSQQFLHPASQPFSMWSQIASITITRELVTISDSQIHSSPIHYIRNSGDKAWQSVLTSPQWL